MGMYGCLVYLLFSGVGWWWFGFFVGFVDVFSLFLVGF